MFAIAIIWQLSLTLPDDALQFIKGDIQSGDLINYVLRTENVDTVMHFAAQVWSISLFWEQCLT
jgi:UDP-glucose 4-epimerase